MWEKVVLNLLSNAFKFTFEGHIEVSLRDTKGGVELQIADTGTGIPASEIPRLFERFHRIAGARARTQEGSGIGLAFVQELVKLHGGSVRVDSEAGVGTTFTITLLKGSAHLPTGCVASAPMRTSTTVGALPFVEEALRWLPGCEPPDSMPPPSLGGLRDQPNEQTTRVLVADDNADMRSYLHGLLSRHWRVETFADGTEALAAARARPPALILADVMMPGLDGFGLVRELRARDETRTVPIVLLSARAGDEAKVEGLAVGADDYIVKPFSARELLARVRSQLELSQLRREAEQERRQFIGELQETVHLAEAFITVAGHDLRNPLSAISTAGALLSRRNESEAAMKLINMVRKSAEEMSSMLDQLVDFAHMRLGRDFELARQDVDLAEICEEALAEAESVHHCEVSLEHTGDLLGFWDRKRLLRLVATIADNGCRHRAQNSTVVLRLDGSEADAVRLEVWNEGVIEPERITAIFEPSFQGVAGTRTARLGGLGLGLYIGKQTVLAHGGSLRVESSRERGTRFLVDLPRFPQNQGERTALH